MRPPTSKELAARIIALPPGPERDWLEERYWAKRGDEVGLRRAKAWRDELARIRALPMRSSPPVPSPTTTFSPRATALKAMRNRPALGAYLSPEMVAAAARELETMRMSSGPPT
jgi:hypothetical protein